MGILKKLNKRPIRILLYVLGLFLFQEIVLRICFPLPEIQNLDRIDYIESITGGAPYSRNRVRSWQSVVDTSVVFEHKMNLNGFRDEEWKIKRPNGKKRAIFIGDSFVEGVMAAQEESIPIGFKAASGAEEYEAFNGGIVGKGLDSYLQLTADLVPIYKPDVVFLCIYANDLGKKEPVIPQYLLEPTYFDWYVPRFYEVLREGNAHGGLIPIWDRSPKSYLPVVPSKLNPWTKNQPDLTLHVTPELRKEMEKGTYNPFRPNSFLKEEHYLKLPPKLGEALSFFNFICTDNQAQPVVVYIPSRNQVTQFYYPFELEQCLTQCSDTWDLTAPEYQIHQKEIKAQCEAQNMQFIDLSATIRVEEKKGSHLYWKYDEHMKGKGYLLLGESIWEQWEQ